jgi:glycosyltransferase involved in cell wall biosynthesis
MTLAIMGCDWFNNHTSSKIERDHSLLFYVTEPADWVIKQIGRDIAGNLRIQGLLKTSMTTTHRGIHNQIIHFGSVNTFLTSKGFKKPHKSNKIVLTWFHVVPDDPRISFVKEAQKYVDVVHTASASTKEKLVEMGIPEEKIVVVPIGVDLSIFKPVLVEEKQKIRDEIGIPEDKIVIGSFQKDGAGWGKGLEPKLVKGPDIFVKAVDELRKEYGVFVLLLGPARGYVKRELEKRDIPYKHIFLKNYLEIPKYYNALDLYLVTSREEGGPKAVLEAMATGIPIVSTKVGMAPEIIRDGYNGFLTDVEDVEMLTEKARKILDDGDMAKNMTENALETIRDYSWEKITKRYYEMIYLPLMET